MRGSRPSRRIPIRAPTVDPLRRKGILYLRLMPKKIRLCVAGATGWAGRSLVTAILKSDDFVLSGAVARKTAGQDIGAVLGLPPAGVSISPSVEQALQAPADVLIDYTRADAVRKNTMAALNKGVHVVVGASGLTADDFKGIEAEAAKRSLGVIACGNFSITAALVKHFSLMAAEHIPNWEIIDYAHADKIDAPSGSTRELAESLAQAGKNRSPRSAENLIGPKEARGADIAGTKVHSVRLPSYVISFETIFGLPHERLTIRHDSGTGAEPYIAGTLLAVKRVMRTKGLIRGLDVLLFGRQPAL